MSTSPWLVLPLVLFAGILVAVQSPINAAVGRILSDSLAAAALSFLVGFVALFALSLVVGDAAAWTRLGALSPWHLVGGLCGAFYVWSMLLGVSHLGIVTAMAALILGQSLGALVIDGTGAFGLPLREISPARIGAVALMTGGLVLSWF